MGEFREVKDETGLPRGVGQQRKKKCRRRGVVN